MNHYLYFLNLDDKIVKFGISDNIYSRLRTMNKESERKLKRQDTMKE